MRRIVRVLESSGASGRAGDDSIVRSIDGPVAAPSAGSRWVRVDDDSVDGPDVPPEAAAEVGDAWGPAAVDAGVAAAVGAGSVGVVGGDGGAGRSTAKRIGVSPDVGAGAARAVILRAGGRGSAGPVSTDASAVSDGTRVGDGAASPADRPTVDIVGRADDARSVTPRVAGGAVGIVEGGVGAPLGTGRGSSRRWRPDRSGTDSATGIGSGAIANGIATADAADRFARLGAIKPATVPVGAVTLRACPISGSTTCGRWRDVIVPASRCTGAVNASDADVGASDGRCRHAPVGGRRSRTGAVRGASTGGS